MQKLIKIIVIMVFFFLFTAMIWGIGEGVHQDNILTKYLVFAGQLLYGNMCYDILKSLRTVNADSSFWAITIKISGEAGILLIVTVGLLILSIKVPFLALVGMISALISYALIFARTLPKLQPAYIQALGNDITKTNNESPFQTIKKNTQRRRKR